MTPWANSRFTESIMAPVASCGVTTVKLTAFDVVPPGLVTVTLKLPAMAMSEARMAAVSCIALTNVVARALPLKLTLEPLRKFVPFTVKVRAGPPAMALVGEILVIVGVSGAGLQDLGGNTTTDGTKLAPEAPAEKGEPGTGLRAPLLSMLKPTTLTDKMLLLTAAT